MTIQNNIIKGISELLFNNDYVVVPGFGGFVSRHQLAHYSVNKGVLHPPAKKIVFNVQLKQNDGVLAAWLKDNLKCDFKDANIHLDEFSSYCKLVLNTKRRMEFENLGLFYLDFENNICFEPKTDINFLIESFGLSPVSLREIEAETKKEVETIDRFEKAETKPIIKKRNYKRMAAFAIGIPVFATVMLLVASKVKPGVFSLAGMLGSKTGNYIPLNYSNNFNEISLNAIDPYVVDANGYANVNIFNNEKLITVNINAVKTEATTIVNHVKHISFSGKFQVVLGCFSINENATRMIHILAVQNIKAGISGINAKGLHVVSCGAFNDKESALAHLQSVKSKYPSAWIMAK